MATLSIPHSFIPGTPALASEVNANFQAVVSWTQGQISTDNLGILGARSVALPSSPALAILSLAQTASQIALNVSNAGTESSVAISQSGALASGKAALLINSPNAQSNAGAAELLMTLAAGSTIPALLIQHGTDTLKLTSSQLTLFNGAFQTTSGGSFSTTTGNLSNLNLIAPSANGIALKVRGRSSDNTAFVHYKSNDDATTYAVNTVSPSGWTLNMPDTADAYTFQVNSVTKAVIDNDGIDGQYIKTASIPKNKMVSIGQQTATPADYFKDINGSPWPGDDITGATVTITTTGRPVLIIIDIGEWQAYNRNSGYESIRNYLHLIRDVTTLKTYSMAITATDVPPSLMVAQGFNAVYFDAVAAGTYTYKLRGQGSYQANYGQYYLYGITLTAYEL